ncbi:MAG: hypothetical protein ACLFPA_08390 [Dichotomicrobium sp.]
MLNRRSINPIKKRTIRHNWQSIANRVQAECRGINNSNLLSSLKMPMHGINNKIYVDPLQIRHKSRKSQPFTKSNCLFVPGDWDLNVIELAEREKSDVRYLTCVELLNGYNVKETSEYKVYEEMLANGRTTRDYKFGNKQEMIDYLNRVNEMYREILVEKKFNEEKMQDPVAGNINVGVGRQGNIILQRNANHRVSAARYMKLKRIPVFVRVIHSDMMKYMAGSGSVRNMIEQINSFIKRIERENS